MAVVYASLIGELLRARGLTVNELQRRLAGEGAVVSRTALDRLASDRLPAGRLTTDSFFACGVPYART